MDTAVKSLDGAGKDGSTITFRREWDNYEKDGDTKPPEDENKANSVLGSSLSDPKGTSKTSPNLVAILVVVVACLFVAVVAIIAVRRRLRNQKAAVAEENHLALHEPEIGAEDVEDDYYMKQFKDEKYMDEPYKNGRPRGQDEDETTFNETIYVEDGSNADPQSPAPNQDDEVPKRDATTPDPAGVWCCQ
ncbi:hypothetical protein ACA910_009371 [Epithemia clementina (nom. ined.)]